MTGLQLEEELISNHSILLTLPPPPTGHRRKSGIKSEAHRGENRECGLLSVSILLPQICVDADAFITHNDLRCVDPASSVSIVSCPLVSRFSLEALVVAAQI